MDFLINTAQAQAAGAGGGQNILSALMLPVLLLVVFYFLLIRPQNKRAKDQREMLSKIAAGDEVATKLQKFQIALVLPKGTVKNA